MKEEQYVRVCVRARAHARVRVCEIMLHTQENAAET